MFSGKNAIDLLTDIVGHETIEELPIKFGSVSANLTDGSLQEHVRGSVSKALKASFAIPGLFTPVVEGENVYVDGGTVEPVPVELARKLGADLVVAVDLFSNQEVLPEVITDESEDKKPWPVDMSTALQYFKTASEKIDWLDSNSPTLINILEKTLTISQKRLTELRLREHKPDFYITPPVLDIGCLDFHRGEPVIEIGRRSAAEVVREMAGKYS